MTTPDSLLLYCRPGFEGECAAEIQERVAAVGGYGYCKAEAGGGFLRFIPGDGEGLALAGRLAFEELIFPRQLIAAWQPLAPLPPDDRIAPVLDVLAGQRVGAVWLEYPDTNEGKALAAFCRKFARPLEAELRRRGRLVEAPGLPRLHLFFTDSAHLTMGLSLPDNAAPWPLGIPRLKSPREAPSRSTLKLEEAFVHFLGPAEREERLRPGVTAVDLGAAPGGWTWQLVRRGVQVTAVDNGPMAASLMASGQVEHRREDGFRYRPPRPVHWLVCDMVEQPLRVARLVAQWAAEGYCRESVFNLKLPMKKRWQEVQHCDEAIREALDRRGLRYRLRYKQLYHDREEVTGHLRVM